MGRLRAALGGDDELLRLVVKELADKDDLLERVEDAVAEKIEASGQLEEALRRATELEGRLAGVEKLEAEYRKVLAVKNQLAEEVTLARSSGGAAPVADAELRRELEQLRSARGELEQELEMRDDIISQLREDFQSVRHADPGDGDALLEERNNLAEQLTLALSQLDELTNRDKTAARLEQMSSLVDDLQVKLEGTASDNQRLRTRLAEAEDKARERARSGDEGDDDRHHGNPAAVWVAMILVFLGIYFGSGWLRAPRDLRPPVGPRPEAGPVPTEVLERVAELRLRRQGASLQRILDRQADLTKSTAGVLRKALDEAVAGDNPYRRGLALLALGSFADALEPLEQEAKRREAARGRLLYMEGRAQFFAGHPVEARRLFMAALERDRSLASAWRGLGDVHGLEDQSSEALRCYREAVAADPGDAVAWAAIGGLQTLGDQLDAAVTSYEKAVALDSELAEAHYALGLLYQRKEDWGKARRSFEETVVLEPGNAAAHFHLGTCYEVLGKKDMSRRHLTRAAELGYVGDGPGPAPEGSSSGTEDETTMPEDAP